jgi:uncharacterized LabA/DUF88 family protein
VRVAAFVDGPNVYNAIQHHPALHRYKWLDYRALARCYVGRQDTLERVYLFTSLPTWDQAKSRRQELYLHALRRCGVEVVIGKFKRRTRTCLKCGQSYSTFEEKLTDVNLAVYLLRGALTDEYDRALIVTGDSDILPAVRMVHELFPNRQVAVVVPIRRYAEDLRQECDAHFQMKEHHLAGAQLPDDIKDPLHGIIRRPDTWK